MIYAVNKRTKEHRVVTEYNHGHPNVEIVEAIVEADAEGWIEWHGGECPLPESAPCNFIFRGAPEKNNITFPASFCDWSHRDNDNDIIAYRPILDHNPQAPEWGGGGLPPKRLECEWRANLSEWKRGFVIETFSDRVWLATGDGLKEQVWNVSVLEFRPIHTNRERWIEAAHDAGGYDDNDLVRKVASNIYDALKSGDLPQP